MMGGCIARLTRARILPRMPTWDLTSLKESKLNMYKSMLNKYKYKLIMYKICEKCIKVCEMCM